MKRHPEDKDAIYNPYTVVQWRGDRLIGVPYHEEYREFLEPMAKDLREAAALSDDAAFAKFLRLRADALLTDDYYASDLAWLDLKNPKFDVIFAPYETYLDDFLGVKTSYGASVLIRNEEESRKLAVYQKYVPEIQDALPLVPRPPSKRGHLTPMEVMDAPYRAGDLRHGYQAVADNLPNDPRIHQEKGTKKIFFKNFMDARVQYVILPIAKILMRRTRRPKCRRRLHGRHAAARNFPRAGPGLRAHQRPAGGHQRSHRPGVFGPGGGQGGRGGHVRPEVAGGPRRDAEIAQAEYYASYVAGIFRTLRFGTGEAHGRAEMMEFNYLLESGAVHAGARPLLDRLREDARRPGAAGARTARDRGDRRPPPSRKLVREVRQDAHRFG